MNKYKINILYNDSDLNINDILIKTLQMEISKNLKNIISKEDKKALMLNKTTYLKGNSDK